MRLTSNIISLTCLLISLLITGCAFYRDDPVKSYNEFGLKCARMGLWNEAIIRWKRIVEVEPNNAKVHNNLGVAYESKGEFKAAMAEYEKAIELDPDNKVYKSNYIRFKQNYNRAVKMEDARDKMQELGDAEKDGKSEYQDSGNEN